MHHSFFSRFPYHVFDPPVFKVHQVAGSKNARLAHRGANVNLAVSKNLAALAHVLKILPGTRPDSHAARAPGNRTDPTAPDDASRLSLF
jgi:hypothetical protein